MRTGAGLACLLVLASLAGCLGEAPAADAPAPGDAASSLACPAPCARPIDAGVRWEPSVAVDPRDPRHLVASSHDQAPDPATGARRSWGLSHVSFDGGATWRTARLPGGPDGDPAHPLFRYTWMDDSAVAFLPDGTLLWSALVSYGVAVGAPRPAAAYSGFTLVVLRSADGGLTFPEVSTVQEGSGWNLLHGLDDAGGMAQVAVDMQDKQWLAVAPDGAALLAWSRNAGGSPACGVPSPTEECTQLVFSLSRDGGRAWSPPRVIVEGGLFSGAFPLVRADGGWVVSYRDTARSEAKVALSTDQGASWTSATVDHSTKFPVLARTQGPAGERLVMAYPAADGGHDAEQAVTLRWSDDGGVQWSAPLVLAAPEHAGRTIPAIASLGDGVVVTYWHPREKGAELRAVLVRDGVASPPLALGTTEAATARSGDYMGLAATPDGHAFAVWNARLGGKDVVTGALLGLRAAP